MNSVLAFLLALVVLVAFHEYGHYQMARWCGVKVLRFSIGMGRVVWRRQKSPMHTEWVLSMLPLGGYVRMLDSREGLVPEHLAHQAFNTKPLLQRALIVAAGPVANFLLAALFFAVLHGVGVPEPAPVLASPAPSSLAHSAGVHAGDRVLATSTDGKAWTDVSTLSELQLTLTQLALTGSDVQLMLDHPPSQSVRVLALPLSQLSSFEPGPELLRRIGAAAPFTEPVMGEIAPQGPARRAGLQTGDRVLQVDGTPVRDGAQLREFIQGAIDAQAGLPMRWDIERAGQRLELTVTPDRVLSSAATTGDAPAKPIGRIEARIGNGPRMVTAPHGVVDSLLLGAQRTWETARFSLQLMGKMLMGEASLKHLSGPITMADVAGQSISQGWMAYVAYLALISVSLGVLNLLPLPMLDGGHLMYYLFEAVTGRPVSDAWLDRLQRAGLAVILLMTSLALYNDMARLVGQH